MSGQAWNNCRNSSRETPRMTALADQIWSLAELRYAETASAQLHMDALAGWLSHHAGCGRHSHGLHGRMGRSGPVIAFWANTTPCRA
jgi:aminobenzoyl-glutamate utilization protein B